MINAHINMINISSNSIMYFVHATIVKPLNTVVKCNESMSYGDLSLELPNYKRRDEIGKLIDGINADAKKLERVNHLTPKQFRGCPTRCQQIDQFMTDRW